MLFGNCASMQSFFQDDGSLTYMLSETQIQQFKTTGVLVVPDVVPESLTSKVIEAILSYTGVELDNANTWYQPRFAGHGIVPLHHAQALWDIRQHPAVYQVFASLYQQHALWVSMDRASYKPPVSPITQAWRREPLHWDCDPWQFTDQSFQGLVYLTDTDVNQGAFCCVPSIFQNLSDYLKIHADNADRRYPKVGPSDLVSFSGNAGSLVIFNRLMPHTSLQNASSHHRFVQYVTMQPAVSLEKERQQRIYEWQNKMPPAWAISQRVPGQDVPEPGGRAELTRLGEKLVGIVDW